MSDPKNPEVDPNKTRSEEAESDKPGEPKKPTGMNYVFKIAPADPKNNFDFEDVADK
jgi:hypothetical protein